MQRAQSLLERLRSKGHRITAIRTALIEIFARETTPLSAMDLRDQLERQGVSADKVTVYRELEFLVAAGMIVSVQVQDRARRYELASMDHHHHLICQKCDRVEDVDVHDDFAEQERWIAARKQFTVLRHSLEFFGLCKSCR